MKCLLCEAIAQNLGLRIKKCEVYLRDCFRNIKKAEVSAFLQGLI